MFNSLCEHFRLYILPQTTVDENIFFIYFAQINQLDDLEMSLIESRYFLENLLNQHRCV